MSESITPAAVPAPSSSAPQIGQGAAEVSAADHMKAARSHEMAAALHHEAARFCEDGDFDNAAECVKQAIEHGTRAMQHAAKCLGTATH